MKKGFFKSGIFYAIVFILVIGVAHWATNGEDRFASDEVDTVEFFEFLEENRIEEFSVQPVGGVYEVQAVLREGEEIEVDDSNGMNILGQVPQQDVNRFTTYMVQPLQEEAFQIARENGISFITLEQATGSIWVQLFVTLFPVLLIIGFFYFMMSQAGQGGGAGGGRGVMNFGKSKAKESDAKTSKVRFSDVAGADEEKAELVEIVEFLKDPRRFSNLGARIPAGVLLEGPPGTGKTLLAKAVAGEAEVPFFSISGSEFVEMFVGVGASRVRDLFENAKKNAPAIIFIDEIDAVGRQRGAGMGGGHDEREQTLNQLLTEMDGFEGNEGIIVMAATNRQDVLDPALLRPGRFDRRILVGRPDVKGREAILKVHSKNKPISSEVDLKLIAKQTPGFSGADLENLLNEAALVAARRDSKEIDAIDIDEAHDRVIAGPAKKDRVISEKERSMVAYHEAGHTICGLVLSDARIVHKVTIVPRGRAGGYAIMLPKEDRFLMTKKELFEQIVGLLGGRVAEEIVFDSQSSGASNDFQQATQLARSMVTQYGMSDLLGPVQYEGNSQVFVGRDYSQTKAYSEQFAQQIDQEVLRILNEAHDEAVRIIEEHRDSHKLIAEKLLEFETLDEKEIKSLFEEGKMPTKRDSKVEEFPRESAEDKRDEDDEAIGTSFEEIKAETEKREEAKEERLKGAYSSESEDEDTSAEEDSSTEDEDLESDPEQDDSETDDASGDSSEKNDSEE